MSEPAFRFTLIDPNGTEHDVTDRADADSLTSLSEETEDDLLQATHSDMTVTLDDADRALRGLFAGVTRGQVFELVVERETGRRRPKWERVFAGVLDIPASVRFDHKAEEVQLQVFSYSKLLELASADALRRSISGKTGSVTAGTAVVTVAPDATGLLVGDEVSLEVTGGSREAHRIKALTSATQVTVDANFTAAFTGAPLTVTTPFPRGETVPALAVRLFAAAGLRDSEIDIAQQLSSVPFPGQLNTQGLPATTPSSVVEKSGALKVYTNGRVYSASGTAAPFTDGGASAAQLDWRPYLTAEPAALLATATNGVRDYVDPAHPLWATADVDNGNGTRTLWLTKNGANVYALDTAPTGWDQLGRHYAGLEVAGSWGEVWVGWTATWETRRLIYSDPDTGYKEYEYTWNVRAETARVSTASSTLLGTFPIAYAPRFVAADGRMAALEGARSETVVGDAEGGAGSETLPPNVVLFDRATPTLALSAETASPAMATFRRFGGYYAAVVSGRAVRLWDARTGAVVADYRVTTGTGGAPAATVFDTGGATTPAYVGYVGGTWFVVSTAFAGVVPYADFSDLSVAGALRELAVITGSHLYVDDYRIGHLIGRRSDRIAAREPVEIDAPIESVEMPVWEWLRRSVKVTGRDEAGAEIVVEAGAPGESASRLEVEVKVPINLGLASALASAYLDYLGALPAPRQLDETIPEPAERPLRLLDLAYRDGGTFVVLRVETNFADREQRVQLVEHLA